MKPRRSQLRRLVDLIRPYTLRWTIATLLLFGAGGVQLAVPQAVRIAVDEAIAQGDRESLDRWVLIAILAFLLASVFTMARHVLMTWLGQRVVADVRKRTFRALLAEPPGYFHVHKSGELVSRLTADIGMLQHAVGTELSIAMRSTLMIIGGLSLLAWTSLELTLVMIAIMPPIAVGGVWIGRMIRGRSRRIQDQIAQANSGLKEAVIGIETVQVFGAEDYEARRYGGEVEGAFRTAVSLAYARGSFMGGVQFLGYSAVTCILWLGASWILDETLTIGELGAFLLYTFMVTGSMGSLAQVWANLQRALGATGRIFEILDGEPDICDAPDAVPLAHPEGDIRFDRVTFTYPTRPDVQVLDEVSFHVAPGEMVALVGRSGAGKSTIASLLHRFHDPQEGRVVVDGHDIRALKLEDLRRALATVHQEPIIFSGTLYENIAYGDPDAPEVRVHRAARDAHIAEFVTSLPEGYETEVGERGVRLSGGQRQRVAIARALLADPRVLVLDEATSHLDSESEALVQDALSRLMEGRSTLVIAHRLSTVQGADRIVVLDQGRVAEIGRHEELMARGGAYAELVRTQASL